MLPGWRKRCRQEIGCFDDDTCIRPNSFANLSMKGTEVAECCPRGESEAVTPSWTSNGHLNRPFVSKMFCYVLSERILCVMPIHILQENKCIKAPRWQSFLALFLCMFTYVNKIKKLQRFEVKLNLSKWRYYCWAIVRATVCLHTPFAVVVCCLALQSLFTITANLWLKSTLLVALLIQWSQSHYFQSYNCHIIEFLTKNFAQD